MVTKKKNQSRSYLNHLVSPHINLTCGIIVHKTEYFATILRVFSVSLVKFFCSLTVKAEHLLCVFGSRVLKKIFGRKREEVTGDKEFRVFSHNTTLLFNKSPTCFSYCFLAIIRPIPRI